jgi:hypothetical protein
MITFEIGIRFLAGYWGSHRPLMARREGHDLDRARGRFKPAESFERNENDMEESVETSRAKSSRPSEDKPSAIGP